MVDTEMLKALIEERGITQRFLARKMGVSDKKIHDLLNGGQWQLKHVVAFCNAMSLNKKQRDDLFFTQKVGE